MYALHDQWFGWDCPRAARVEPSQIVQKWSTAGLCDHGALGLLPAGGQ